METPLFSNLDLRETAIMDGLENPSALAPGPELDAEVARALGLAVLGMAECTHYFSWYVPADGKGKVLRPVYLNDCVCHFKTDTDAEILGHIAGCLEVVPCYSTDDTAALAAVDEMRGGGNWASFQLEWSAARDEWNACFLADDNVIRNAGATRALAICLAIVAAAKAPRSSGSGTTPWHTLPLGREYERICPHCNTWMGYGESHHCNSADVEDVPSCGMWPKVEETGFFPKMHPATDSVTMESD